MATTDFTKLTDKKRTYMQAVLSGKTKKEARDIAKYSESTRSSQIESPRVKAAFAQLLRRHIPAHVLAKRVAEGVNATETKFFAHEGRVVDQREVVAWGPRKAFAEIAAEWGGYVEKDKAAGDVNLAVGFTLINNVKAVKT